MDNEAITRTRVDELLKFYPVFYNSDGLFNPPPSGEDDELIGGFPTYSYPKVVADFYEAASQPCWFQYGYDPAEIEPLVYSDEAIAEASLTTIKSMLTYCQRGERFAGGHWWTMLEKNRIGLIFRRLRELRHTLPDA